MDDPYVPSPRANQEPEKITPSPPIPDFKVEPTVPEDWLKPSEPKSYYNRKWTLGMVVIIFVAIVAFTIFSLAAEKKNVKPAGSKTNPSTQSYQPFASQSDLESKGGTLGDTARMQALNRLKAEMENYASNNNGTYPHKNGICVGNCAGFWQDFYKDYLGGINLTDPDSGKSIVSANPSSTITTSGFSMVNFSDSVNNSLPTTSGSVLIVFGATCSNGYLKAVDSANPNPEAYYSLVLGLSKSDLRYCLDNS